MIRRLFGRRPPTFRFELFILIAIGTLLFGALAWWIATIVCGIPVGWPLDFPNFVQKSEECGKTSSVAALVGTIAAWTATSGWLIQRHTGRVLARKQHTMNVLMNMRNSELFNTHRVNIRATYPVAAPLSVAQVAKIEAEYAGKDGFKFDAPGWRAGYPPADSIFYYLNYLEAIAISIWDGDLEETMVRVPLEPTFKWAVTRFWPVLMTDLKVNQFGDKVPRNQTYAELYEIAQRWGLTKKDVDEFNAPYYADVAATRAKASTESGAVLAAPQN